MLFRPCLTEHTTYDEYKNEDDILDVIETELRQVGVRSFRYFTITALVGKPIVKIDDDEQAQRWDKMFCRYRQKLKRL